MMSPEIYFTLTLIVKMAITAGFVLAATVTALVATLPLGAGPVYVFLAMDHDPHFLVQSAVSILAINAVNVLFALRYAWLAQMRPVGVSLGGAFLVWLVLALTVHSIQWSYAAAAIVNVVVIGASIFLARPLRHVRMPVFHARWTDLAMRAVLVATLVGITVTFSFQLGSGGSGILAVFPVILLSIMYILHKRVGGKPTAAVLANAPLGLAGFAGACTVLHFTAEPLGSAIGLSLALATSVGWSLLVLLARRRGIAV